MSIQDRTLTAGTTLTARYKGADHTALVLESDGKLAFEVDGEAIHQSLSAAGKSITGRVSCDGWTFWSVADDRYPQAARKTRERTGSGDTKRSPAPARTKRKNYASWSDERIQARITGLERDLPALDGEVLEQTQAELELAKAEATTGSFRFDATIIWFRKVVMGVDVGKRLHVVVRGYQRGRWYLIDALICTEFEELDELMKRYQVSLCVVDSQPETRKATDFFKRHIGKVYLCRYGNDAGIAPHWDWIDHVAYVRVPRTLAMDGWLHAFKSGEFAVPEDFRETAGAIM